MINFDNKGILLYQDDLFAILIKSLNETDIFSKIEDVLMIVSENENIQLLHDVIKN